MIYLLCLFNLSFILLIYLFFGQSRGIDRLTITLVSIYLQGLPTTTISPHYDLLCPLPTTTSPYPTSLPTVWTETPWEGDATPFTPPPQAPEMVQPHQSLSSCKTAGSSTAMSHWRQGQDIVFCTLVFTFLKCLFDINNSRDKITAVKWTVDNQWKGRSESCRFNIIPVSNRLPLPQKNKRWGGLSSYTYSHCLLTQALKEFLFAI